MAKPNYNNSIVNLMATIGKHFNYKSPYKPLNLTLQKNVVLFVIDGLGYHQLLQHKNTTLYKHLTKKITTVFPTTTAAAITTFMTGLAPGEHAIPSWFTYFKEIATIALPLPFVPRFAPIPLQLGVDAKHFFKEPFIKKIKTQAMMVMPLKIVDSEYTNSYAKKRIAYQTMQGMFKGAKYALEKKKKYIWMYYSEIDHLCHAYGHKNPKVTKHIKQLDKQFTKFIESIKDTTVIVTADHGHMTATDVLDIKKHPKLQECLVMPVTGEPRAGFCYVHAHKKKEFETYVKTKLKKYCELKTTTQLIKQNYFGLHKPHKELHHRLGDYILLMKKNYIVKDKLITEKNKSEKGNHGGLSDNELYVPLIVIQT